MSDAEALDALLADPARCRRIVSDVFFAAVKLADDLPGSADEHLGRAMQVATEPPADSPTIHDLRDVADLRERAAVVRWLRGEAQAWREATEVAETDEMRADLLIEARIHDHDADRIERGEHVPKREG